MLLLPHWPLQTLCALADPSNPDHQLVWWKTVWEDKREAKHLQLLTCQIAVQLSLAVWKSATFLYNRNNTAAWFTDKIHPNTELTCEPCMPLPSFTMDTSPGLVCLILGVVSASKNAACSPYKCLKNNYLHYLSLVAHSTWLGMNWNTTPRLWHVMQNCAQCGIWNPLISAYT